MIEQPLDEHDIYFHSLLRQRIKNPICLDESMHTFHDVACAIELQAADIINIKVGRVGGLVNARRIHDLCQKHGIPVWIGSRVGSDVAEAMRLAAASLPNCNLPTDVGCASTYMSDTLVVKPLLVHDGYKLSVPDVPGLGVQVDRQRLKLHTERKFEL